MNRGANAEPEPRGRLRRAVRTCWASPPGRQRRIDGVEAPCAADGTLAPVASPAPSAAPEHAWWLDGIMDHGIVEVPLYRLETYANGSWWYLQVIQQLNEGTIFHIFNSYINQKDCIRGKDKPIRTFSRGAMRDSTTFCSSGDRYPSSIAPTKMFKRCSMVSSCLLHHLYICIHISRLIVYIITNMYNQPTYIHKLYVKQNYMLIINISKAFQVKPRDNMLICFIPRMSCAFNTSCSDLVDTVQALKAKSYLMSKETLEKSARFAC